MFAAGDNNVGQLGFPSTLKDLIPEFKELPPATECELDTKELMTVACGGFHSVALDGMHNDSGVCTTDSITAQGHVYSWGGGYVLLTTHCTQYLLITFFKVLWRIGYWEPTEAVYT